VLLSQQLLLELEELLDELLELELLEELELEELLLELLELELLEEPEELLLELLDELLLEELVQSGQPASKHHFAMAYWFTVR
jgi:hypothetical protein